MMKAYQLHSFYNGKCERSIFDWLPWFTINQWESHVYQSPLSQHRSRGHIFVGNGRIAWTGRCGAVPSCFCNSVHTRSPMGRLGCTKWLFPSHWSSKLRSIWTCLRGEWSRIIITVSHPCIADVEMIGVSRCLGSAWLNVWLGGLQTVNFLGFPTELLDRKRGVQNVQVTSGTINKFMARQAYRNQSLEKNLVRLYSGVEINLFNGIEITILANGDIETRGMSLMRKFSDSRGGWRCQFVNLSSLQVRPKKNPIKEFDIIAIINVI